MGKFFSKTLLVARVSLFINLHSVSSSAESALPSSQDGCPTLAWGRAVGAYWPCSGRGLPQLPACPREAGSGWAGPGTATPVGSRAGDRAAPELRWRDRTPGCGEAGRRREGWTRWRRGPPPPSPTREGSPRGSRPPKLQRNSAAARAEGGSPSTWRPSSLARGGSKGIPTKNIKHLAGVPLIG